jgi:hypothetical protein
VAKEAKMTSINAPDSRVNVLIRLVGGMVFVLGVSMAYLTYSEEAAVVLVPPLVPVMYLCSSMLIVAGFLAFFARYKESGKSKA